MERMMASRQCKVSRSETKSVQKNSRPSGTRISRSKSRNNDLITPSEIKPVNKNTPRYSFSTQIPEKYNQDYVCVLPRDPHISFVYWEFTNKNPQKSGFNSPSGSKIIMTVKEHHQDNSTTAHQIELQNNRNEQFISLPQPEKFHFEFGAFSNKGEYSILSRTPVQTPPLNSVSVNIDKQWFSESTEKLISFSAGLSVVKGTSKQAHESSTYLGSAGF